MQRKCDWPKSRDIGQGLLKLATRWKIKNVVALLDKLAEYRDRETTKLIAKGRETQAEALADRVETLIVLCEGCETVDCVRDKINNLFQDGAPTLTLSTMHRSKGREWDRVFLYGYNQWCPSKYARQAWQQVQEKNLQYVAITRAKDRLLIVDAAAA
jgi:superfamily I DNA/RNA helicase